MSHILADRVLESTTTTGTGALTLAAAVTGFRRFSAVCAVADTVPYFIEAIDSLGQPTGDYEYGIGTYSGANTLTRTTVLGSSNAGAAVNLAAGSKNVGIGLLASRMSTGTAASGTWRKHPDGSIEQWGALVTPGSGNQPVTFPVAFASAPEMLNATINTNDGVANGICTSTITASAFIVSTYLSATGAGKALNVSWHAIGRAA